MDFSSAVACTGQVWDPMIIPVFLDIKMRVAEEVEGGDRYLDWAAQCVGDRNANVTGNKGR